MKLNAKYEKGKVPAGLENFVIEKDGFMVVDFDDDVALATNPALALKNAELLGEKKKIQENYDGLVASTGTISKELNDLRIRVSQGGQVTADEVAILTALKGIENVTPDDVKKIVAEYPQLKTQIQTMTQNEENRSIAGLMKWKPEVFGKVRGILGQDVKFETQDVTENDKSVKKVFVSYKDASGVDQKQELSVFAKASDDVAPFLPSLQTTDQRGPEWLPQNPGGGEPPAGVSVIDQRIAEQNARAKATGNPLAPAQTPVVVVPPAQT